MLFVGTGGRGKGVTNHSVASNATACGPDVVETGEADAAAATPVVKAACTLISYAIRPSLGWRFGL
jgi:hypothetical protein